MTSADLKPLNLTLGDKVLGSLRRIKIEGMPDLIAKTSRSSGATTILSDVFLPTCNPNSLINVGINSNFKYSEIDNPMHRNGFFSTLKGENPKAILLSNDNFRITISSTGLPISIEYKTQPELRTSNYPASVDPDSGFKFYESNTSDSLRSLESINGKSIEEIEHSARRKGDYSNEHLLGYQESLIDLMIDDNDYVLRAGFKHIDLAEPLMLFFDLAKNLRDIDLKNIEYNGSRFSVYCDTMSAAPNDPFRKNDTEDSYYPGNGNVTVRKEGSDWGLFYSGLNAHLIAAYGFYEGKAEEVGDYRLDPQDLIEFFNLKLKQNTTIENNI